MKRTLHLTSKIGAAASGFVLAGSLITAMWLDEPSPDLSMLFRKIFGTALVTALVFMFGILFTWDGKI